MDIDARGDMCPIPVVKTHKALKTLADGEGLNVAVDNFIATQNLEKMCAEMGLLCAVEKISEGHYVVTIEVGGGSFVADSSASKTNSSAYAGEGTLRKLFHSPTRREFEEGSLPSEVFSLVVISSTEMGDGDDKLGAALMKSFIFALAEGTPPQAMVFYNGGAKLTAVNAPTIPDLERLEAAGVKIYTCGACINYFALTMPAIGEVTDMYSIVKMMNKASKVIRP